MAQQQQQQDHPIFTDIARGDLEAVQQRVLADAALLEEQQLILRKTPLLHALFYNKPAIALWLIANRGQHNLEAADHLGMTPLHWASSRGQLEVVQALVAAGANAAALTTSGCTCLIYASMNGHTDTVTFLLQLPDVKATIDAINIGRMQGTALSFASLFGHQPTVQLLLDAGADPTIPSGPLSPLNRAPNNNHHAIAALLRHVIAEADCARALHKARSLLAAGAAALACLQGRVEQGDALPLVELTTPQHKHQQQHEKLRAVLAFAVGVSGGEKDDGLCEELYVELLGYMLPAWADKGPES